MYILFLLSTYSAHDTNTQIYKPIYKCYRKHTDANLNILEQSEIYKHHKTHTNAILNYKFTYKEDIFVLLDVITQ